MPVSIQVPGMDEHDSHSPVMARVLAMQSRRMKVVEIIVLEGSCGVILVGTGVGGFSFWICCRASWVYIGRRGVREKVMWGIVDLLLVK